MSKENPSPKSPGGEDFDVAAVARAVARQPLTDDRGRHILTWPVGELTISPTGHTAQTDIAVVASSGRIDYRRLELTTEGATLLATAVAGLTLFRFIPAVPEAVRTHLEHAISLFARRYPFDLPVAYPGAREVLQACRLLDALDVPQIHAALGNVLSPQALDRQFRLADVHQLITEENRLIGFGVDFPGGSIGLGTPQPNDNGRVYVIVADAASDDSLHCRLSPASALLLIAVHEGLAQIGIAERALVNIDARALEALREALPRLRQDVIDELNVFDGYQRLATLFDPAMQSRLTPGMPLGQLNAIATMAMDRWRARRGPTPLEHRVDLDPVTAAAGREPAALGDGEHAYRFDGGWLSFRLEGDLAIGRGGTVSADRRLVSWPIAFTEQALGSVAWAISARDQLQGEVPETLGAYMLRALEESVFDARVEMRPLLRELHDLAQHRAKGGAAAGAAAQEILRRRPRG